MTTRLAIGLLLAAAARAGLAQTGTADTPSLAFTLRVDPPLAAAVNEVLAKVARPNELTVPTGKTPAEYLSRVCGGEPPAYEPVETPDGKTLIRAVPCVRIRRNFEIEVTRGDTLEGLALRNGLPSTATARLKVFPANGSELAAPEDLQIGDRVVIPEVPLWTRLTVDPEVIPNRAALVEALAERLGCRGDDPEACLTARKVTLLDWSVPQRRPAPAPTSLPSPTPTPREGLWPGDPTFGGDHGRLGGRRAEAMHERERPEARSRDRFAAAMDPGRASALPSPPSAPPPPPPPPPVPPLPAVAPGAPEPTLAVAAASPSVMAAAPLPATLGVHPDQWPYDHQLLAAILRDALSAGYLRVDAKGNAIETVGVADGGLANVLGGPLPGTLFDVGVEGDPEDQCDPDNPRPEPDGCDDDDNDYVDDIFGAGVPRVEGRGDLGNGDLGLCEGSEPPYSSWNESARRLFSHGAVVSSVATALGLRTDQPDVDRALPKLVFFRMLRNVCSEDAGFDVREGPMSDAYGYLKKRAAVINLSFLADNDRDQAGQRLVERLKPDLPYENVLLVLAAGDDEIDLDVQGNCPACLGDKADEPHRGGTAAKRVLVVGAATRDLRRTAESNYGEDTVGLFAPAEPIGARDIAAQEFPSQFGSTSYAAPLVALAAALVRSYESDDRIRTPMAVKDRLLAATWPLDDPPSRPIRTHVGVLDLVKAAAVRHMAIEVKEAGPGGALTRRTYVGTLLTPFHSLSLCAGSNPFKKLTVQALRLGEPSADGEREILVYSREELDPRTNRRMISRFAFPCQPNGELRFRDLVAGEKVFALSQVTAIQLPWIRP